MLVAAFCTWHEQHAPAAKALEALLRRPRQLLLAGPVLLETYAVLTRLPPPHRLSPAAASELMRANVGGLRTLTIDGKRHWELVEDLARRGVAGGRTYDALVVACAVAGSVDRIVTLNRRHFETLVPDGMAVECPLD